MIHARSDYDRIQDPAANHPLLLAYQQAHNLTATYDATEDRAGDAYHRAMRALAQLATALEPTLGLIINDVEVAVPAHPIADDEPVFVLRASDRHAPATVEFWAGLVYDRGNGNEEASRSAVNHVHLMRYWQHVHGAKRPDAPPETLETPFARHYTAGGTVGEWARGFTVDGVANGSHVPRTDRQWLRTLERDTWRTYNLTPATRAKAESDAVFARLLNNLNDGERTRFEAIDHGDDATLAGLDAGATLEFPHAGELRAFLATAAATPAPDDLTEWPNQPADLLGLAVEHARKRAREGADADDRLPGMFGDGTGPGTPAQ